MAGPARTKGPRALYLMREVLDHELVDAEGRSCGMVDDIELEWTVDGPSVVALHLGPGAWSWRLPRPLGALARHVFGSAVVRVPWTDVSEVTEVIRLRSRASRWGAGELDRWLGRPGLLRRLRRRSPEAIDRPGVARRQRMDAVRPRTLCEMDVRRLVAEDGRRLGRLFELGCRWQAGDASSPIDELIYGATGLLERVGMVSRKPPSAPWSEVRRIDRRAIVLSRDARPAR